MNEIKPVNLSEIVVNASQNAITLLEKMLVFNPDKRITADESLKHGFFSTIRDEEYEAVS